MDEEAINTLKVILEEATETEDSICYVTSGDADALKAAIKALEIQPCEDCISREQTLKAFAEKCGGECACCEYNGSGYDNAENCKLIKSMPSVTPRTEWVPVSERLPEEDGKYLITLENGDVCKCKFNPDYIDEEHDKGAFTYYHDYFDNYTLGLIDSEEVALDAIAWMPFEPYTESEDNE